MAIDWTKIYKKHKGLWVALKNDEKTVISAHKTAGQALKNARNKGYHHPILTRVPENLKAFVGIV